MEMVKECLAVLHDMNMVSIVFRIFLAAACGCVLGIERAKSNQSAGMRTYMLVCIGAAVVMLTGQYMYAYYQAGDPARLGAQVISGIGFLGAGSIMTSRRLEVRELTTAAGLWVAACIGLAIGIGFYSGGLLGTLAVYLTVSWLKPVAYHFSRECNSFGLFIEVSAAEYLPVVYRIIEGEGGYINEKEIIGYGADGGCSTIISVRLPRSRNSDEIVELLSVEKYVKVVRFINYCAD